MKKLIIIILIFSSCASKKTIIKDRIVKDTLIITKDRFITQGVLDTLRVDTPCDTITGSLKDFEKEIRTNNAKVTLKSVKGSIEVSVNIDSIVSSRVNTFKSNYKLETEKIEVIRNRIPFWIWIYITSTIIIIFLLIKKGNTLF